MVKSLQVLVDDQDSDIQYLCDVAHHSVPGTYFNNTWTMILSPECGSSGWFTYSFIGTSIQINAPSRSSSEGPYSVEIDGGSRVSLKGKHRYTSPTLDDGFHNVTFFAGASGPLPPFDYLTYTAGPSTPIKGRTIIHDDDDGTLVYNGHWTREPPVPVTLNNSTSLYQDTAHWSSTVGDSLLYKFMGTSVLVMGVSIRSDANASLAFTLDGNSTVKTLSNSHLDGSPMAQLFHAYDLDVGPHTLFIDTVDVSVTQPVGIDFIAYNTSYSRLSDITTPFDNGITIPQERTQAVAIAGGVIGSGIFITAIAICLYVWRRQRDQQRRRALLMIKEPW
ncbi:hypothetical protein AX17_006265 [Amanita inopinata Kibby_2008]|nr:hypothetical protein AX17_006265 [Amanita inopinata Kibby_2008]